MKKVALVLAVLLATTNIVGAFPAFPYNGDFSSDPTDRCGAWQDGAWTVTGAGAVHSDCSLAVFVGPAVMHYTGMSHPWYNGGDPLLVAQVNFSLPWGKDGWSVTLQFVDADGLTYECNANMNGQCDILGIPDGAVLEQMYVDVNGSGWLLIDWLFIEPGPDRLGVPNGFSPLFRPKRIISRCPLGSCVSLEPLYPHQLEP
jgi:hypothetical protein